MDMVVQNLVSLDNIHWTTDVPGPAPSERWYARVARLSPDPATSPRIYLQCDDLVATLTWDRATGVAGRLFVGAAAFFAALADDFERDCRSLHKAARDQRIDGAQLARKTAERLLDQAESGWHDTLLHIDKEALEARESGNVKDRAPGDAGPVGSVLSAAASLAAAVAALPTGEPRGPAARPPTSPPALTGASTQPVMSVIQLSTPGSDPRPAQPAGRAPLIKQELLGGTCASKCRSW